MTVAASALQELLPHATSSPEETMALGAEMAALFQPGDVVGLYGDLGAGKTHLIKGIASGLGIPPDQVTSPTFTLLNEYAGAGFPVYHFDAYRIRSMDEFFELGFEDYFFGEGLCLVEWPEKVEPLLPPGTIRLRLTHEEGSRRVETYFP